MTNPIVFLSDADKAAFGRAPLRATHDLHQHELFTDEALIELLDRFPRHNLHALNMGTDPMRWDENRLALHDGVSGAELLRAVRQGRLWLNCTRVNLADPRYRQLIDRLYEQLGSQLADFHPRSTQGTLLISSPHALVYYHADCPASALWHIRGRKRIWIYPALDERFLKREHLEDLFAGIRHEYMPYDPDFDRSAVIFDLEPGQWATWPQNAPHRVTNLDSLNVSLSTEHFTRDTVWRARIYSANRFYRERLHMRGLSTEGPNLSAFAKVATHRIVRKLGFDPVPPRHHTAALRVVPDAPQGVVALGVTVDATRETAA